jgi:FdhD protein
MAAVTILEPSVQRHEEVCVPREEALTLVLNGRELVTFLASPGHRRELVAGFLFCEGLVQDPAQLVRIEEDDAGVRVEATGVDLPLRLMEKRVLGSGCGKAVGFLTALDAFTAATGPRSAALSSARPWVQPSVLCAAAHTTYAGGALYRRTRGTHAAALFRRSGEMVALSEDIGRHNAVDKAIGGRLLAGESLVDLFVVVTGRVSSEMVGKILRTPIPLVVSKSVPTDAALAQAARTSMTLVACRGGQRLKVYTGPELVGAWN